MNSSSIKRDGMLSRWPIFVLTARRFNWVGGSLPRRRRGVGVPHFLPARPNEWKVRDVDSFRSFGRASPSRRSSTHWSRWNCLDGTKSG